MNAGRELDALVAEKVMGLSLDPSREYYRKSLCHEDRLIPRYSTDIAAAWLIVEWAQKRGNVEMHVRPYAVEVAVNIIHPETSARGSIEMSDLVTGHATEATAPHAICIAALRAVMRESGAHHTSSTTTVRS